jgi:putative hydrolase of the HAD superfamily
MNRSQVKRRNTIANDIAATRPTSHSPKTASLRPPPPAASTFDTLGRAQVGGPARQLAQIDMAHVDTWVFDLDNTLYPADCDLWQRITTFIIHHFGLDGMSSRALQKYYYKQYGTTLRGLMDDHGVSAEEFLAFVHDIDRSSILPNPSLAAAIAALPGRKLILTNGSRDHALRTAEALGLAAMFEDIFDIVDAEFVPKPERVTYQRFFDRHDVDPKTSAMFEDIERNLVIPHERGMATTLVVPKPGQKDHREPFEIATSPTLPHVDYMISDLEEFLRDIADIFGSSKPKDEPTSD